MRNFFLLLSSECTLERKSGKRLIHFLGLGILLSLFSSLALQAAFLNPSTLERVFPLVFSLLLLVCNLCASQEVLHAELKNDVHEALRLFGVDPGTFFLSKLAISFFLSSLCALLVGSLLFSFLALPCISFIKLAAISLLASLSYSSKALIISGLSARSRASSLLFALLFLPLLAPVFLCSHELSMLLFDKDAIFFESFWFSLLSGLAVIYSILGVILFPYTIYKPL